MVTIKSVELFETGSPAKRHQHKLHIGGSVVSVVLEAEFEVCTECGNLHMEGDPAPDHLSACAVCGGDLSDVELDDLIGL